MKLSLNLTAEGKLCKTWYILFIVNFFIMGFVRYWELPIPTSLAVEAFYLICIINVMSDSNNAGNSKRFTGIMLGLYIPWVIYAILEVGNMSSELPFSIIINRWFAEVRTLAFQVIYGMLITAAIFVRKQQIHTMYKIWGICVIICTLKTLIQQFIGFDTAEYAFLEFARRTHFVNGIVRYFSLFSDAANYGCNMAATTVVFGAVTLCTKQKRLKIFYAIVTCAALYGLMASGTRTGVFVLGVGAFVYAIMSRRVSAIVTCLVLGGGLFIFLTCTNIGQGNHMIRRMRSAFNKEDASFAVREMNQQAMVSYINDLPLGLGAGIRNGDVPQSNKNYYLSVVPPDSTWVYVNIRYGHLGKYIFLFSFFAICIYAGYIVFFRIRDPELRGLLAALASGASAMVVAGYANHIQLQYPNCFLFFGQLMLVYLGPSIDARITEERQAADRKLLEQNTEETETETVKL